MTKKNITAFAAALTDAEIAATAQHAAMGGDHAMATDCRRALAGSARARRRVAATLLAA